MSDMGQSQYVLGLDLGSASIGWALVSPREQKIVAAGVRVFDPGVDLGKFDQGKADASNNVARRQKRLLRRQLRRHAGRQRELFQYLQSLGWLPSGLNPAKPRNRREWANVRNDVVMNLDARLREKWMSQIAVSVPAPDQVLPYYLRAHALDHELGLQELGRVIYHLSQRRGFKSNRKLDRNADMDGEGELGHDGGGGDKKQKKSKKDDEDLSKVYDGIDKLHSDMRAAGARTLGEYFSGLDPALARIRHRWTSRVMYEEEFRKIWDVQAAFKPDALTRERMERIQGILFYQKPLLQVHPGLCELEKGELRIPAAHWEAQRFRLLQKLNDLRVEKSDVWGRVQTRELTRMERSAILEECGKGKAVSLIHLRKKLQLRGTAFNLEKGNSKGLPAERTSFWMRRALGESRWEKFTALEKEGIFKVWYESEDAMDCMERLRQQWGLSQDSAAELAKTAPEEGYFKLSRLAIQKLLPLLEAGESFKSAEKQIYGHAFSGGKVYDQLPPVEVALPMIPNPAVKTALTELRKVVNALVRRYGKPEKIRIELARDLKRNSQDRRVMFKKMGEQENARKKAKSRLMGSEIGIPSPKPRDVEKLLLWDECGGVCPYTGKSISFQALFDETQVDVEHILPKSRFPDDSFQNKTLAFREINAQKGGRTPYEAFASDEASWNDILVRVNKFKNPGKLRRFLLQPGQDWDSFTARQLADTRYVSKMAARYLGHLYGGRDMKLEETDPQRIVYASSGMVTATLRRAWGMESILRQPEPSGNGRNPGKPRTDHRHHAVDAIVIALTKEVTVQDLAYAAVVGQGRVSDRSIASPWAGMDVVSLARPVIMNILVSHAPRHRLAGALHDDTVYSDIRKDMQGRECVHLRRPVHALSVKSINNIVDPMVRAAVMEKVKSLGNDAKAIKKLENDPPFLRTKAGKAVKICRVRVRESAHPLPLGLLGRQVVDKEKHHAVVFYLPDEDRLLVEIVSRLEANRRLAEGSPIVNRRHPEFSNAEFRFSIMNGDLFWLTNLENGQRRIWVNRTLSQADNGAVELDFVPHFDAQDVKNCKASGSWLRITSMRKFAQMAPEKITLSPLGVERPAHD